MNRRMGLMVPLALCTSMGASVVAHGATWLKTGSSTSRPYGHIEYCSSFPSDCSKRGASPKPASVALSMLQSVNVAVNRSIKPVTDQKQLGVRDKWSPRVKAGDCEDFALAKRAALQRRGIAKSNLLLAVGSANGEAHTVLVVRTTQGDFVLNNLTDAVLPVHQSGVGIRKIQSPTDGADWLRVTGKISSAD